MRYDWISAAAYAKKVHAGQTYGTKNYYYHLNSVVDKVMDLYKCELNSVEVTVAYLHDTLEDTDSTYEQLRSEFGQEAADTVVMLTKTDDLTRKQYLQRFEKDSLAWKVKVADCLCNLEESVKISDIRRIKRYTDTLVVLFNDTQ